MQHTPFQSAENATDSGSGNAREMRVHPRYPVQVDALITGRGFESKACVIRDFCVAGMFISFEESGGDSAFFSRNPIYVGDTVTIHFFLKAAARDLSFDLTARVARVLNTGIGVALVDADPEMVSALTQAARSSHEDAQQAADDSRANAATAVGPGRANLLPLLQKHLQKVLADANPRFFKSAEDALFTIARESRNANEQREFYDSMRVLKNKRENIETEVRLTLQKQMEAMREGKMLARSNQGLGKEMTLIGTREFEEFLAVNECVDRAESLFRSKLNELEQRLSQVLGRKVDAVNNPLGASVIARAYSDALLATGIPIDPLRLVLQRYHESVSMRLQVFFDELNAALAAQGLQVVQAEPAAAKTTAPPRPRPTPPAAAAPAAPSGTGNAAANAAGSAPAPASGSAQHAGGAAAAMRGTVPPGQHPGTPAAGGRQTLPPASGSAAPAGSGTMPPGQRPGAPAAAGRQTLPPASGSAASAGSGTVPPGQHPGARTLGLGQSIGLFQAAHNVLGMRRNLRQALHAGGAAAGNLMPGAAGTMATPHAAAGAPAAEVLPPAQLSTALESVNHSALERTEGIDPAQYRELLNQVLSARAANQTGGAPAPIMDEANWDSLELVLEVFNSVLTDPRVYEEVKPLLRRLRTPVNQVAVQQPELFENNKHPARQLLNNMTQVRSLTGADPLNPVRKKLETIVDMVADEAKENPAIFDFAAGEVSKIVATQQQEYNTNLSQLVKASEEQQQFLKARRKASGQAEPKTTMAGEWVEWLTRAKRVQLGDLLELENGGQKRRVNVAWVGEEQNNFVLSDTMGRRVANLGAQELAMQLRRGSAQVLDQSRLPTVERAVFSSLQKIHNRLETEVSTDTASALLNVKAMHQELEAALESAKADSTTHVLAMLNLKDAPLAGITPESIALIVDAGKRIRQVLGSDVKLARADADFMLLLLDLTQGQAYAKLEQVKNELLKPLQGYKYLIHIGMARFGEDVHTADTVITSARLALKSSQQSEDGSIRMVRAEEAEDSPARLNKEKLAADFAAALEAKTLRLAVSRLVLQKADGKLPQMLELAPSFIPGGGAALLPAAVRDLAENGKRSAELDRWLVQAAMEWVVSHPAEQMTWVIIRLSPLSLRDSGLVNFITNALMESGAVPGRLCFELSDTSELGHRSEADELIRSLREFGCHFMFGDFGSAHSSFANAKDLNIELVKLADLSKRDVVGNPADVVLTRSAIEMAHFVGIPVVVDNIESAPALKVLNEMGIEYAQGEAVAAMELQP